MYPARGVRKLGRGCGSRPGVEGGSVGSPVSGGAIACVVALLRNLPSACVSCAARSGRPFEGPGDPRPRARPGDPPPPGRSAAIRAARPARLGGAQPPRAAPLVGRVPGTAGDAAALAPAACCPPVDASAPPAGPAADRWGGAGADPAPGAGEHKLGYVRIVGELRKPEINLSATLG